MNAIAKFLEEWETMSDEEKDKLEQAWKREREKVESFYHEYEPCYSSYF